MSATFVRPLLVVAVNVALLGPNGPPREFDGSLGRRIHGHVVDHHPCVVKLAVFYQLPVVIDRETEGFLYLHQVSHHGLVRVDSAVHGQAGDSSLA